MKKIILAILVLGVSSLWAYDSATFERMLTSATQHKPLSKQQLQRLQQQQQQIEDQNRRLNDLLQKAEIMGQEASRLTTLTNSSNPHQNETLNNTVQKNYLTLLEGQIKNGTFKSGPNSFTNIKVQIENSQVLSPEQKIDLLKQLVNQKILKLDTLDTKKFIAQSITINSEIKNMKL